MAVPNPSESETRQGAVPGRAARATTTAVRLDADEVEQLDRLAEQFAGGDRSATIRLALRRLETEGNRAKALDEYLAEAWGEHGGVDEEAVAEAGRRYFS